MTKFKEGTSGNPRGRPKSQSAALLRQALEADIPQIIAVMVDLAKAGDIQAGKILLDRVFPPLKPVAMAVQIDAPHDGSLVEKGNQIIQSTMAGEIAPEISAQLLGALTAQSKIIEIEDLSKRLQDVEQLLKMRNE